MNYIQTGLYTTIRAVQYDISQSSHHFFAMLERYNPKTCTFFTPVKEMGLALHEMYEVSGLVMGDIPYEEYVSSAEELHLMEDSLLWYTQHIGKCYATSIFALRSPVGGLEKSSKWLGQITSSMG